mmetsp:Transcript_49965/g.159884  ORF Transcript_49965/g.159884 Transcript_49965/m.159884 type:complete len:257 (+) Transcript_49965:290-1060(+)
MLALGVMGARHTDPWGGAGINFARFVGDMMHMASRQVLLWYMLFTGNATGVSLIGQEGYLLVFLSRYAYEVLFTDGGPYLKAMRWGLFITVAATILLIRLRLVESQASEGPNARRLGVGGLAAAVLVAAAVAAPFPSSEWAWVLSQVVESVCMVPQVLLLRHTLAAVPPHVVVHFWGIGLYRLLYIVSWIHRASVDPKWRRSQAHLGSSAPVAWWCGAVQEAVFFAGLWFLYRARAGDARRALFRYARLQMEAAGP